MTYGSPHYHYYRWVFGVTVWQIFNNGSIPLGKHSNEELLNRYLKIKEQQNSLDDNMASNIPILGWFPLKLDIPKQDDLTVNKKIQKLVNYTITDYLHDQVLKLNSVGYYFIFYDLALHFFIHCFLHRRLKLIALCPLRKESLQNFSSQKVRGGLSKFNVVLI